MILVPAWHVEAIKFECRTARGWSLVLDILTDVRMMLLLIGSARAVVPCAREVGCACVHRALPQQVRRPLQAIA